MLEVSGRPASRDAEPGAEGQAKPTVGSQIQQEDSQAVAQRTAERGQENDGFTNKNHPPLSHQLSDLGQRTLYL